VGPEAVAPPPRPAAPDPRRFQHLMDRQRARELGARGVSIEGIEVHDLRDTVRDGSNARDLAARRRERDERLAGERPPLEVEERRRGPRSAPREEGAFMKPLALTARRKELLGRSIDPRGRLPTDLYTALAAHEREVAEASAKVAAARGGLRRAVGMGKAALDLAEASTGHAFRGCPGVLLPLTRQRGEADAPIVSSCVNTNRRLLLTSNHRSLDYWGVDRLVSSTPLPPGTTTRHLMYDRVTNCVFAVRDDHKLLVLHARQLAQVGHAKVSEDTILCAATGTRQRVVVTGHARGMLTVWRIHNPTLLSEPSVGPAVRLVPTQNLEPSGVTDGHWVASLALTEGDLDWCIAAVGNGCFVWDLRAGSLLLRMEGLHDLPISSVSFDEETKYLATGAKDWSVRVWDLKKDVMETTVRVAADGDKPATLAETLAEHKAPVTRVLWEPDSHSLLSVSADGTMRMYDGRTIEQWDVLQLVLPGMAGVSECGVETHGGELAELLLPGAIHVLDRHRDGYHVAVTVGDAVVFVDLQPSKKFRGMLPKPAVQVFARALQRPPQWDERRPWTDDVMALDENGAISVLDTRSGYCSMEFQTQSKRLVDNGDAGPSGDKSRELPFWQRCAKDGVDGISCVAVLEDRDEVYSGWSRGGTEVQSFAPQGREVLAELEVRRGEYGSDHKMCEPYSVTAITTFRPHAFRDVDRAGLRRALGKLAELEEQHAQHAQRAQQAGSAGTGSSPPPRQSRAKTDAALQELLAVMSVLRLGKRWRNKVRKPVVIYGTSNGMIVMTSRVRNTRPNVADGHTFPIVGLRGVDSRSAVVSVDQSAELRLWSFVPPQALPFSLKTRSLPGILVPMAKISLGLTSAASVAFALRRRPNPYHRTQQAGRRGAPGPSSDREPGAGAEDAGEGAPPPPEGESSTHELFRELGRSRRSTAGGHRRSSHAGARAPEEPEAWALDVYTGGGAGDIAHARVWAFPRPTEDELEDLLSLVRDPGAIPDTPPLRSAVEARIESVRMLRKHTARVSSVSLSDAIVASCDLVGTVLLWDEATGALLQRLPFRRPVDHLCFVGPRDVIAVCGPSMCQLEVEDATWRKTAAGRREMTRRGRADEAPPGEYQYRYRVDWPEDEYLRSVTRIAHLVVFEPGSDELKELERLFAQIRSVEGEAEYDIEQALALIEAEVRAQAEVQQLQAERERERERERADEGGGRGRGRERESGGAFASVPLGPGGAADAEPGRAGGGGAAAARGDRGPPPPFGMVRSDPEAPAPGGLPDIGRRGSARARGDAPRREGRVLRHTDNVKQHLGKGIIIPTQAHQMLAGKWSAADVDAVGGSWHDILKATTLGPAGDIPLPSLAARQGRKGKARRKARRTREEVREARVARRAERLLAEAYVSDVEEKMTSLAMNRAEAAVLAGDAARVLPAERPPSPAAAPPRRKKKRRRRRLDPWKVAERERAVREKMSRLRFVLTSMQLPRVNELDI